jgi:uncharacterized protein (DUF302 family)
MDMYHNKWVDFVESTTVPKAVVYTIGNPFIAVNMLKHDITAGYQIPPRLMVVEGVEGDISKGTTVLYHQPSSVLGYLPANEELARKFEGLDEKLEGMISQVVDDSHSKSCCV